MKESKKEKLKKTKVLVSIRFFELATTNKNYVNGLSLHEAKSEILLDYTGDFDLNGLMIIGPFEHKTIIRFRKMDDFESYLTQKIMIMIAKLLLLLGMFSNLLHLKSMLLKEALTLKVLFTWENMLNIMDKMCTYQLPDCVLSIFLNISLFKMLQKIFEIS